ncbi:helix-turn-helix transcriptional regulator [Nocardia otitidiscaviarum]|uniref:helix-turn-helix domain-containing protein n=1 Tax=Nocardia otitidiscaviarum TaxID=1823 RepID=UPI0004A6CA80|nr:helix-turn-helix domain-containing protein [Nocardia otitidiscaviarum]MBF6134679.1 helix-turn-helix transcriptional regulator [Nocardia otitidiscaviarum]MBF6236369.1 helix-turn-helix transcriptional regulator [Nocardia otitidiscaviarum]MBF6485695.1 helix-turn-helix transcriptional regulator [Nocardia otitidiscaviarum]
MEPREAIAGYLRERRAAAGLTRAELARRAGISEGLIQKLEQGTRPPTSTALGALFDALDVPINYREYAANVLQPELTAISATTQAPSRAELDFLESIPYPACYQTVPALDLIAGNAAYRRAFPGLEEPGTNIMAWMLLHPVAREVIADWEREVHLMVHSFRHMAHGVTAPERIAEITELCARSPDWQRLWNTDIPPADIPRRPVRIRSVEGGDWTPMYVQLLRCELPRRDWWVYSMVPLRGIRPAP